MQQEIIDQIVTKLLNNEIIIFPTDTIYGLLGSAESLEVARKIQSVKGCKRTRSFVTIFSSLDQIKASLSLSNEHLNLIKKFQDLSLTFVFPRTQFIKIISFNDKVAIRLISNKYPDLQKIVAKTGPLFATSCNYSDQPYINETYKILEFSSENKIFLVDWEFDDKDNNEEFIPSTIIDFSKKIPKIIRIGFNYQKICERLTSLDIKYETTK